MDQAVGHARYSTYKDSGLPWLGEIPTHWTLKKAKFLWREKDERSSTGEEQLLSVSQYLGVVPKADESRSESLTDYKICNKDDLVVNIMLAWMSGLGVTEYEGIVSPAYCVYRQLESHNPRYFNYLYRTPIYLAEFARRSLGIVPSRWRMYTEDFGQILTLLPTREEQDRIANFLDQKTAEIDEAIAKKQRLIELLKEQKAILINQAVTKGLNPDAPMRDSGVEWIGEVPRHWVIRKLKYYSEVQSGITLGKVYTGNSLINTPYLRVANVQDGHFNLDDIAELQLPQKVIDQHLVRVGDILITEGGDIDKLGRGTVWEGEIDNCIHQNHIFAVRIKRSVASEYFVSLVLGADYGRKYFTHTANKTTNLASTNRTKLGNFPIALPPLEEQQQLIDYANDINERYGNVIDTVSREISSLGELKQIIVAEAVTGKIKI